VVLVGIFLSRVKKGQGLKLRFSKLFAGMIITIGVLIYNFAKDVNIDINSGEQW
jgi:hypothetical protein